MTDEQLAEMILQAVETADPNFSVARGTKYSVKEKIPVSGTLSFLDVAKQLRKLWPGLGT